MPRPVGQIVLALSSMGLPLTQRVLRRGERRDAVLVELILAGLLTRDVAMVAAGAPHRLRRAPAILLWLETVVGLVAAFLGLRLVLDPETRRRSVDPRPGPFEGLRRTAVGALFGLHTVRFWIFLQPDRGLRVAALDDEGHQGHGTPGARP